MPSHDYASFPIHTHTCPFVPMPHSSVMPMHARSTPQTHSLIMPMHAHSCMYPIPHSCPFVPMPCSCPIPHSCPCLLIPAYDLFPIYSHACSSCSCLCPIPDSCVCPIPTIHAYAPFPFMPVSHSPCMPIFVMLMPNKNLNCTLGAVCDHQDSA